MNNALPTARQVKDVIGQIDVGTCRVAHCDNWGDERWPWRVYGAPNAEGDRELLDEFAQYREAVAFARKITKGDSMKNPHAVALGRSGGNVKSAVKAAAAIKNGRRGGRPPRTLDQAAVALRTAAVAFANLGPAKDLNDSEGSRANIRLLKAALVYAELANEDHTP